MPSPADVPISALRSGSDDLALHVRTLTPDQLTGPSGASEWTVAQVLSHLGSGASGRPGWKPHCVPPAPPRPTSTAESGLVGMRCRRRTRPPVS
jgi:hypothetical protein